MAGALARVFGRVLCVHVDEAVMGPQYTRTETERATTPMFPIDYFVSFDLPVILTIVY